MKHCNKCGAKLTEEDLFCQECGAKIEKEKKVKHAPEVKEEKVGHEKKSRKWIWIVSIIILLIILALVIFAVSSYYSNSCKKPYIKVGKDCCLDANNNNVCDSDEIKEEQSPPAKEEVKFMINNKEYICSQESFNLMLKETEEIAYDGGIDCAIDVAKVPKPSPTEFDTARMRARNNCPSIKPTWGFTGDDWLPSYSTSSTSLEFDTSRYVRDKQNHNFCYADSEKVRFDCSQENFDKLYQRVYTCLWNRGFFSVLSDAGGSWQLADPVYPK